MAEIAIGIDLGTSNSCVARATGGTVEVLPNAYGEKITASVVAFREDGSVSVGSVARANVIHDPQNTVSSAKRLIEPALRWTRTREGARSGNSRDNRIRTASGSSLRANRSVRCITRVAVPSTVIHHSSAAPLV